MTFLQNSLGRVEHNTAVAQEVPSYSVELPGLSTHRDGPPLSSMGGVAGLSILGVEAALALVLLLRRFDLRRGPLCLALGTLGCGAMLLRPDVAYPDVLPAFLIAIVPMFIGATDEEARRAQTEQAVKRTRELKERLGRDHPEVQRLLDEDPPSARNAYVIIAVAALFVLGILSLPKVLRRDDDLPSEAQRAEEKRRAVLAGRELVGSFSAGNKELGEWTLAPIGCLDGTERGFKGVVFTFPNGAPVEELRLDNSRDGDNVVEVRLADRHGTVYRVREAECESVTGSVVVEHLEVNGRPMRSIEGEISFACAAQGLKGHATFDGCLPR